MQLGRRNEPPSGLPGPRSGRCKQIRRPEDAILAGMVASFRRIVAECRTSTAVVAAARVRLKVIAARTGRAAFAVGVPESRCTRARFLPQLVTRFAALDFTRHDDGPLRDSHSGWHASGIGTSGRLVLKYSISCG